MFGKKLKLKEIEFDDDDEDFIPSNDERNEFSIIKNNKIHCHGR